MVKGSAPGKRKATTVNVMRNSNEEAESDAKKRRKNGENCTKKLWWNYFDLSNPNKHEIFGYASHICPNFVEERFEYTENLYEAMGKVWEVDNKRFGYIEGEASDVWDPVYSNACYVLSKTELTESERLQLLNSIVIIYASACTYGNRSLDCCSRIYGLNSEDYVTVSFDYHNRPRMYGPEYHCELELGLGFKHRVKVARVWFEEWEMKQRPDDWSSSRTHYFPFQKFSLKKSHIKRVRKFLFSKAKHIGKKISDYHMMQFVFAAGAVAMNDNCATINCSDCKMHRDQNCAPSVFSKSAIGIKYPGDTRFLANELRIITNEVRPVDQKWKRTDWEQNIYEKQVKIAKEIDEENKERASWESSYLYTPPPPTLDPKLRDMAIMAYNNLRKSRNVARPWPCEPKAFKQLCRFDQDRWLNEMPARWKENPALLEVPEPKKKKK